jgi:hypothetical protein
MYTPRMRVGRGGLARLRDRSSGGAELRQWRLDYERELLAAMLTPVPWHHGKPIPVEKQAPPPNLDAITEDDVMAWELSGPMRALAEGREYRLWRSDLPDWHPARRAGDLGDALVLTKDNKLLGGL